MLKIASNGYNHSLIYGFFDAFDKMHSLLIDLWINLDTKESFDLCLVAGEIVGTAPSNNHNHIIVIWYAIEFLNSQFARRKPFDFNIIYTCE